MSEHSEKNKEQETVEQGNEQKNQVYHKQTIVDKLGTGNRVIGILASICMIVLGIVILMMPVKSALIVMEIATIGFVVYGIYQIISYFRTPSEYKNGWMLANGIIFIILGVIIFRANTLSTAITYAFLLGFLALSTGITQISSYGIYKKAGVPNAGGIVFSGILNMLLGLFFLFSPFFTLFAAWLIFAIYLIVAGVAVFAMAASGRKSQKSQVVQ